jgi:hypothetical protein
MELYFNVTGERRRSSADRVYGHNSPFPLVQSRHLGRGDSGIRRVHRASLCYIKRTKTCHGSRAGCG